MCQSFQVPVDTKPIYCTVQYGTVRYCTVQYGKDTPDNDRACYSDINGMFQ